MGLRKNRTGNSGNNKNKNKNKHENKKNKHKKKLNLTRLSRGTGKMSKTYVGLSENSVPHSTQWFCWSLSLLNGYFIGGIPHFQTYPCCGREAGFFHGEMWQEEMSTMSAAAVPGFVTRSCSQRVSGLSYRRGDSLFVLATWLINQMWEGVVW